MVKNLILLCVLLANAAFAQPPEKKYSTINNIHTNYMKQVDYSTGRDPYNPARTSRGVLRFYEVGLAHGRLLVTVVMPRIPSDPSGSPYITVDVDMVPLIRSAATAWNSELQAAAHSVDASPMMIEILQASNERNGNMPIRNNLTFTTIGDFNPDPETDDIIALGVPVDEPNTPIDVRPPGMYFRRNIVIGDPVYSTMTNAFSPSVPSSERAKIILYFSVMHEFGHILGLMHPRPCGATYCVRTGASYPTSPVRPENALIHLTLTEGQRRTQLSPIMISAFPEYFRRLRQNLGRPVLMNDVVVTRAEALALVRIMQGCYQIRLNMKKDSQGSCMSLAKEWSIIYPRAAKAATANSYLLGP